jgi:hypothetical protein
MILSLAKALAYLGHPREGVATFGDVQRGTILITARRSRSTPDDR